MKNIPLRDRAWPAPTPQEQDEIDEMAAYLDEQGSMMNIVDELEQELNKTKFIPGSTSPRWSKKLWKVRRSYLTALIEYVKAAETFREHYFNPDKFGFVTAEMNEAWYQARKKLGLK